MLVALGLLIWLAYRAWSILLLARAAAILAAALAGEPLLAHWTQTFMTSAAQFVMQFFPIFLLGALFGKLAQARGVAPQPQRRSLAPRGSPSRGFSFCFPRLGARVRIPSPAPVFLSGPET